MAHPDGLGVRVEVVGVDPDAGPEEDDGRPGIVSGSRPRDDVLLFKKT